MSRYRERGPSGLVSGHRGKRSNNALTEPVRGHALALVRERYVDFGPTFACEKLVEAHGLRLSAETLRQWMMSDRLWCAKSRRAVRAHPSRPRRRTRRWLGGGWTGSRRNSCHSRPTSRHRTILGDGRSSRPRVGSPLDEEDWRRRCPVSVGHVASGGIVLYCNPKRLGFRGNIQ